MHLLILWKFKNNFKHNFLKGAPLENCPDVSLHGTETVSSCRKGGGFESVRASSAQTELNLTLKG